MPGFGYDVKEFKVYTWRLTNWKKLDKKLTSPEFECGGHRWYSQFSALYLPDQAHRLVGVYCFSPSEIQTHPQTIPSLSISTMLTPRRHPKVGMLALNSPSSYRIYTILQYTPLAVCISQ